MGSAVSKSINWIDVFAALVLAFVLGLAISEFYGRYL
jgi:hypothetical protein